MSISDLIHYNKHQYRGAVQALLPYSTASGNAMMYTTNIVFDQAVDPKVKFKLHHKLRVDYILSRHPLDWLASGLELQTPYFYLYKNSDNSTKDPLIGSLTSH